MHKCSLRRAVLAICVSLYCVCNSSATLAETPPPVEAFARLPALKSPAVSPDGTMIATLMEHEHDYALVVFRRGDEGLEPIGGVQDSKVRANWVEWKSNEMLVASFRFHARRQGTPTVERRLFSLRPDSRKLKNLVPTKDGYWAVQIADRVVDWLPDDPEYILLQFNHEDPEKPAVQKVNLKTARARLVQRPKPHVSWWLTDAQHEVRVGGGLTDKSDAVLHVRNPETDKWENWSAWENELPHLFYPIAFALDPSKMYVLSDHEHETLALWRFDVPSKSFEELIYAHPTVDVESAIIDDETGEVQGVSFIDEELEVVWISEERKKLAASMQTALPDFTVNVTDWSPDKNYAIVRASSVVNGGVYLLYDAAARELHPISATYPDLSGYDLAPMHAASYEARDGLDIPAFVTLPSGVDSLEDAKALPFVIQPHGGPTARDFQRFDYLTQFLASRGYGVLQMNFRGSTGYGQGFRAAGKGEWGQAMQNDVTDGAHWLMENGWADPDRLAILGGSYGGYAALMGAVRTPELFQCAVSINGVSDLVRLVNNDKRFINWKSGLTSIGLDWRDRESLRENSPSKHIDKIVRPILLIHGEDDRRVRVGHSRHMSNLLRRANKPHKFVELKDGDHGITKGANRLIFLQEVEAYLSDCLN